MKTIEIQDRPIMGAPNWKGTLAVPGNIVITITEGKMLWGGEHDAVNSEIARTWNDYERYDLSNPEGRRACKAEMDKKIAYYEGYARRLKMLKRAVDKRKIVVIDNTKGKPKGETL